MWVAKYSRVETISIAHALAARTHTHTHTIAGAYKRQCFKFHWLAERPKRRSSTNKSRTATKMPKKNELLFSDIVLRSNSSLGYLVVCAWVCHTIAPTRKKKHLDHNNSIRFFFSFGFFVCPILSLSDVFFGAAKMDQCFVRVGALIWSTFRQ